MGAIVRVTTTTPEAFAALLDVVQADGIYAINLGENSGMHEVVFSSANVAMGTGFTTLQRLMNEHTARLDLLAEVEAGTPTLPPHREYRTEVQGAPDPILRHKVDHLLKLADGVPEVDALSQLRDGLLREATEQAAVNPGLEWLELTQRDKLADGGEATQPSMPWALVYMGDKPLDAVPVPESD